MEMSTVPIYVPSKKQGTEEFGVNWICAIVDFNFDWSEDRIE
jgi:hypothetical protein